MTKTQLTKKDNLRLALYAANLVLHIFEKKYPNEKRPREAIKAVRRYLKNQTEKNRLDCSIAYENIQKIIRCYTSKDDHDAHHAACAISYAAEAAVHDHYSADISDYYASSAVDAARCAEDYNNYNSKKNHNSKKIEKKCNDFKLRLLKQKNNLTKKTTKPKPQSDRKENKPTKEILDGIKCLENKLNKIIEFLKI